MPEVSNLVVTINADTRDLESGLARAQQSVSSAGSAIQAAMGGALIAGIAGVGAAFVGSVKSAADFEKQMSAVGAVAGASASEMEALTKSALQLGKDTSFSASEAAKGIEELVKAGVAIEDVIGGGARAALDLAAAGAVSVGDAAEIASNAMNVFNLKGADMAHVADVIAGAANASAIGVNDYKFSLSAAGAVAATVGISFESLSQAIAVMGNAGIKGSDAGTSLKTMMMNLQPATKAQTAEFERLGIATVHGGEAFSTLKAALLASAEGQKLYDKHAKEGTLTAENLYKAAQKLGLAAVKGTTTFERWLSTSGNLSNAFFTATGEAKSMAEIAEVLKVAMAGMTKEQQLASLEILFGADAVRAGAVLMEAGAEGFEHMAEAMSKVTAQQVANERLNNLWGSVEKLKGSLETAAIILGGQFTPALKRMADGATDAVNIVIEALEQIPDAIATVQQVLAGEWAPDSSIRPFTLAVGEAALMLNSTFGPAITAVAAFITGTLMPAFDGMLGPIAAAVAAFLGVIATAGLVQAAIAAVAAVLAFLITPLGLVAVAAAALALAWTTNFMGIQETTAAWWAVIQPILTELVAWLGERIPPVLEWISTTGWPALVAAGKAVSEWITGTAVPAFTQLVDWLGPKLQPVVEWLTGTGWPGLVAASQKVYDIGLLVIQFVQDLWAELEKRGIVEAVTKAFIDLMAILEPIYNVLLLIVGIAAQVIGFFTDLAVKGLESGRGVQAVADAIQQFFLPITAGLASLRQLIDMLNELGRIKLPSLTLPGFGGGGASTLSSRGGASDSVMQWADLITMAANEQGISPADLAGLVDLESGGNPRARSGAGAMGLGQVMPFHFTPGQDPYDPLTNLRAAARVYRSNLDKYGDPLRAAAGYFGAGDNLNASDGSATGHDYIRIFQERRQRYQSLPMGGPGAMDKMLPEGMRAPMDLMETVNQQFVPQWVRDMGIVSAAGIQTTAEVSAGMDGTGAALVTMSTDAMGNVTRIYTDATGVIGATITDASGVIVNSWGTMATGVTAQTAVMSTGVTEQTNLMASGALTSVTNLGTGILTSVATTSGTTIATVTDMQGQVTAQYATLANGAVLTMGDMAAGIMTSTTDLGTGMLTIVQDTSGNYIATVTDLAGNVTAQYTQLGADVVAATAEQSAGVIEETQVMAATVLTSVTDLGDGILTITEDTSGQMVATITDMAGNVTSTYQSMGQDVIGSNQDMVDTVVEVLSDASSDIGGAVEEWGEAISSGMEDIASEAESMAEDVGQSISEGIASGIEDGGGEVEDAVREIVEDAIDAAKDEAESDSPSKLFARELGLPIAQGVTAGLLAGAGDVMDATRSLVQVPSMPAPAVAHSGGGGTQTIRLQVEIGGRVAEEIYVTGKDLATRRGRD